MNRIGFILLTIALLPCVSTAGSATPDFWDEIPESPGPTIPDAIRDGYWRSQFQRVNRTIAQAKDPQLVFFGTRVILLGILPVKNQTKWKKCEETNRINSGYRYPKDEVVFLDLKDRFQNPDGSLKTDLFLDGTHLTTHGYEILANELEPVIERLMKLGPIAR